MAPPINKFLVTAGIITLIQAAFQTVYACFAIAQYFCVIDFLQIFRILVYIRILYFHNPNNCDSRINIGEVHDGMADQAFVLLEQEPFTTTRTFIINCVSLGLSFLWVIGSILLIKGASRKHHSNHTHWPWLAITLPITVLDLVAVIAYANDSFHTQTLSAVMTYVGGTASGAGNLQIDTSFASWLMVIIYSRFVALLFTNVFLMIYAIVDCTRFRSSVTSSEVVQNNQENLEEVSEKDADEVTNSSPSVQVTKIPRPGLSQSFRTMKDFLFNRTSSSNQAGSTRTSLNGRNRNRAVNFPEEIELPATLENMIAEQQRRLNMAMIDTSGRRSPGQGSRSLTYAHSFNNLPETSRGRRGTAVELQGQMPWSYIPAPANRMRDQLPPDEDLPPVPLPDYTAFQSARKASVHRAASSLSSLTQKKEYLPYRSPHREASTHLDVLY